MPSNYTVKSGDCISSIAYQFGFLPDSIWEHPGNAGVKAMRKNPNTLVPGDVLVIPDKGGKIESCAVDRKHRFRRKAVPAKFVLRILSEGKPVANAPYTATILGLDSGGWKPGSATVQGTTDGDGVVSFPLPPNASSGVLVVNAAGQPIEYDLRFGELQPVDRIEGLQARLNNLGFDCGSASGTLDEQTRMALGAYQALRGLPVTGDPDAAVLDALRQEHDD